jgi:hypothetical protein
MLDNIKSLKENLKQNVIHIKDFSDVDGLLYYFSNNSYVVFDSISLKNYFINNTERCVINCNSSYDKFIDEMEKYYTEETIFNNINFCNDIDILNIVDKTNNLRLE